METAQATVIDFARPGEPPWRSIDDVVMGGVSRSRLRLTGQGTALFEGELSLENNGGFASVRASVGPLDLSAYDGVVILVRGDGLHYRLRLRTDDRFDGVAYQAAFATSGEGWQSIQLPFAEFLPTYRGRVLTGVEPLARDRIQQVGLMIADRQAGSFCLEVAWIRTFGGEPDGGRR